MKHYKHSIIAFVAILVLGVPWLVTFYPQTAHYIDNAYSYIGSNLASVFLHKPIISVVQLKNKYTAVPQGQPKVRIFIMPGHEPNYGGAEYGDLRERNMTVELADDLANFLKNNSHYEVIVARDKDKWNNDLQNYFNTNWDEIKAFFKERRSDMIASIKSGGIAEKTDGIIHNSAPQDVALRLYGMNKWVNENNIDIAIHIHFNDYPRRNSSLPGEYSGFAIYVPERQYATGVTTHSIADAIFKRLSKYNPVSDLPKENAGVVEDQDLIAIGSNNTLDVPSFLVEYGYIYEPQFVDNTLRSASLRDLAFQTYLGLQDFFGGENDTALAYDTLMLPYNWKGNITKNSSNKSDVLALQTALLLEGVYPPQEKSKNDCPRSGGFGPCTISSLTTFQNKYGITNEKGIVGEKTKKILNYKYSSQLK